MKHSIAFPLPCVTSIEAGFRRSVIRPLRNDDRNPEAGDVLALYSQIVPPTAGAPARGVGRLLGETIVEEAADIVIIPGANGPQITVGNEVLEPSKAEWLAQSEGFQSSAALADYFNRRRRGEPFHGRLIVWHPLRPVQHGVQ